MFRSAGFLPYPKSSTYALIILALTLLLPPRPTLALDKASPAVVANIGQANDIERAIFSADDRLLATLDDYSGYNIRLWDVATGRLLRRLEDQAYIGALAFTPDSRWIVSGHKDGKIALWDLTTGAAPTTLLESQGDDGLAITSLWIDPAGELLVAGNASGSITLWTLSGRKQIDRLEFGELTDNSGQARVIAVRLGADRNRLMALTAKSLRVFDIKLRQRVFAFDLADFRFFAGGFVGEDGALVQSAAQGCSTVALIRTEKPTTQIEVDKPTKCPDQAADDSGTDPGEPRIFVGAERLIVTRSGMPGLKPWSLQTSEAERTIEWPAGAGGKIVGISPALTLAAATENDKLTVRRLTSGEAVSEIRSFGDPAESVALSADGRTFLLAHARTGSPLERKDVDIWRIGAVSPKTVPLESGKTTTVRDFAPGPMLAAVSSDDAGEITVFSLETGKAVKKLSVPDLKSISRLRMSPDGGSIAVIGVNAEDKSVALTIGSNDGAVRTRFPGRDHDDRMVASSGGDDPSDLITTSAFTSDGKRLALGRWNGKAEIWNVEKPRRVLTLPFDPKGGDQIRSLAFSADGRLLAGGSRDSGVFLWNLGSKRFVRTFNYDDYLAGHVHFASVAISRDQKLIASGLAMHAVSSGDTGPEYGIKLWNAATGKLLLTLRGHQGGVGALGFSADDRWLVSASYDGTIRYWDRTTGRSMATCATAPDGRWLIITESGFYAGSPESEGFISVTNGLEGRPASDFHDTLYRPDLVEALLGGDRDGRYRAAAKQLDLEKAWAGQRRP